MGIDVYILWPSMTDEDVQRQYTGFRTDMGHVGYLREAYHGGPYATRILATEGFDPMKHRCAVDIQPKARGEGQVICARIPAATLRERLPAAVDAVKERARKVYHEELNDASPEVRALYAFVDLYDMLERSGKEPAIYISW